MIILPPDLLLDSLPDGVYATDRDRRIVYWNKAAEAITGYCRSETMGSRCSDNLLQHVDEHGRVLCLTQCPLADAMEAEDVRTAHVYLHHKEGHRVPVVVRVSPVRDSHGEVVGAVEVFSEDKGLHEVLLDLREAQHEALADALTDAPNRKACDALLAGRLERARLLGIPFGIAFVDVDHFKCVNDEFGHQLGDHVLLMVTRTMERAVRPRDVVTRRGGDEFIVVFDSITKTVLGEVTERIRALIEQSFIVHDEVRVSVTVSLGATMATPEDAPETLVARADRLLYESKETGRNRLTVG
ncbi:GGDEF domain-containing protein [Candidatus Fermentibacteria bacterium]|nr:GGDEF domain-containing protein [Candidatus Fermentibacteria bacterium]